VACPVDWSWAKENIILSCLCVAMMAWERSRIYAKRVELAIEIVSRMEAALDMYRSIENVGE